MVHVYTLELQLTSLELCMARRRVPMLRVRVGSQTHLAPCGVLTRHRVEEPGTRSLEGGISWVPFVRALGVKWELSVDDLVQSAVIEQ